jgi:hypothetical protein
MPSLELTDVASARLDVISFFVIAFFLSALLLRWAWNVLAKDFAWMPRLRFKHATGLLLVCSLFLYVVLTMISGARELMTPGAWVKTGATYQLAAPDRDGKTWLDSARRTALENLRDALWQYAKLHEGNLPPHKEDEAIPPALWLGIHPNAEQLAYIAGGKPGKSAEIVVYEPEAYGGQRLALLLDGTVIRLDASELRKRLLTETGLNAP